MPNDKPVRRSAAQRPGLRQGRSRPGLAERIPRYLQVASALRSRIREGRWGIGDRIATIEALEREFDVARITVRQAIDLLVTEGLVRPVQGKGTFVAGVPDDDRWLQLATDWDHLIRPIRENVPHDLAVGDLGPPRLEPGDGMHAGAYRFLESVQLRRREPFALARVHIEAGLYDRDPSLYQRRPALSVLSELPGLAIARAHQTLVIGTADTDTARRLRLALNAPTVEARCVVTDTRGVCLYVGHITYRGDCVKLNIELIGNRSGVVLAPVDR